MTAWQLLTMLTAGTGAALGAAWVFRRAPRHLLPWRSPAMYALAVRGSHDGFWEWDVRANVLVGSERWAEMLGLGAGPFRGRAQEWWGLVHADDRAKFNQVLRAFLTSPEPRFDVECRFVSQDGAYQWYLVRGCADRAPDGRAQRVAGSLTNISDRKSIELKLSRHAFHDPLTGLANRAFFMRHLERVVRRAREGGEYAVLFMDIDGFKTVNDTMGHAAGDQLLVGIANRMLETLRPGDLCARLGGDEFVILLAKIESASAATRVAERVRDLFKTPFTLGSRDVLSSCSIGIALGLPSYKQGADVLHDADAAMYHAKASGKARFAVYDPTMNTRAFQVMKMEADLPRALAQGELQVHYQPVVNLRTHDIEGFEALVRWPHPTDGDVPPSVFIPIAESKGLIRQLGEWVLSSACSQMAAWQAEHPHADIAINVNLSPIQLSQGDFVDRLAQVLENTGVRPSSVHLEITEGAMMDGGSMVRAQMEALRCLGVKLVIDDFGTGYSSLSSLHQYDIDGIKIDRSFVAKLGASEEHSAIVRTITALASHLDLSVTVEGVETQAQLNHLVAYQCEHAQGFLFSPAVPAAEASILLQKGVLSPGTVGGPKEWLEPPTAVAPRS
jgi:diguanylate cyclase (GGDEF)-like protein/PAS domain S-box-containing protein